MTKRAVSETAQGTEEGGKDMDTSMAENPAEGQEQTLSEIPENDPGDASAEAPKTGREKSLANLQKGKATRFSSGDEAAKNGRKGGHRSAQKRRERKTFSEALEIALTMPIGEGKSVPLEKLKTFESAKGANLTVNDRMILKLVQKAVNGDIKAIELIREQIGEAKPKQVETSVRIVDEGKLRDVKKRIDGDPELLKALLGETDDQ